jgi:hypothetical protein
MGALAVVVPLLSMVSDCGGDAPAPPAPPPHPLDLIAPPADGSCRDRESVMQVIRPMAISTPAPPPFCTDRPDLTDWITVERDYRDSDYHAFDAAGCLATWHEVPCP